jgi:hypothetical protein
MLVTQHSMMPTAHHVHDLAPAREAPKHAEGECSQLRKVPKDHAS